MSEDDATPGAVELRASPMNVNLPFTFGSEDAERQIRDVIDAVADAAFRDGVVVGVRWYIAHGGVPTEVTSASRKIIQRDDKGQIVAIVDEVLT